MKKPVKVTSVVISTQHSKDLNQEKVKKQLSLILKNLFQKIIYKSLDLKKFI